MNLEQGLEQKSAALDITPLIDVVFLLVLFFAVTTSFIDPKELEALRSLLVTLETDKSRLSQETSQQQAALTQLRTQLASVQDTTSALQGQLATSRQLKAQLEQSLNSAQAVQAQLTAELTTTRSTVTDLQATLGTAYSEINDLRASLTDSQQAQDELTQALSQSRAQSARAEAQLAELRAANQERDAQLAAFRTLEARLQAQIEQLGTANATLTQESADLRAQLAETSSDADRYRRFYEENQERIAQVSQAEQTLTASFNAMDLNSILNIEREPNQLTIQLSNQILFDSGRADLKPEGLGVLRRVGEALKGRLGELTLQVGGHTDNIPIAGGRFADNWELSAARAVNVVSFLESEVGINPALMAGVGYGENRPVAPNDTPDNRALNRRIELVLLPQQTTASSP